MKRKYPYRPTPTPFDREIKAAIQRFRITNDVQHLHNLLPISPSDMDKGKVYAQIAIQTALVFRDGEVAWGYMRKARECWADNYHELAHGLFIAGIIRKALADPLYCERMLRANFQ